MGHHERPVLGHAVDERRFGRREAGVRDSDQSVDHGPHRHHRHCRQTLTVSQDGAAEACTYGLSPSSVTVDRRGRHSGLQRDGRRRMRVDRYTVRSWIAVTSGSGSGNGTVSLAVAPNPTASPRTGTVSVEGQVFTVTQAGLDQTCRQQRVEQRVQLLGRERQRTRWTSPQAPAARGPSPPARAGSCRPSRAAAAAATLSFAVKQNNGITNRQATLTVGPWAVTVFQSGKARRTK